MKKILVVDDEKAIVTLLEYNLKKAGYSVDTVSEGVSAYNMAVTGKYDFILLDLMLPGMDGIEITRRLRQERIETPIIILTARDQEYDKIIGLELGADDYLTKPFSPREVIARIKAISRRITSSSDEGGASQPAKVEKEFYEYAGTLAYVCYAAVPVLSQKLEEAGMQKLFDEIEMPVSRVLYEMENA